MKVFLYYFWDKIIDCKSIVEGNEAKFVKKIGTYAFHINVA